MLVINAAGYVFRSSSASKAVADIDKLEAAVKTLKSQVDDLKGILNELVVNKKTAKTYIDNEITLFQNSPNPTDGISKLRCFLASENMKGRILIRNTEGKLLQTFAVSGMGMHEMSVRLPEATSGVYFYSLLVNNKIIDTKKMIVAD